ncbi:hypothetical protein K469DRAFT_574460, partial [Zopfia rhizophila CBS 207.26]
EEIYFISFINFLKAYNAALIPSYNYSFLINLIKRFFKLTHLITLVSINTIIRLIKCLIAINPLLIKLVLLILTVKS